MGTTPVTSAGPVIQVRGLTRDFGQGEVLVRAVADVDLDIARGTFTAVMGPSGSGKSTLLHLLAGLDRPTSGSVRVDGREITDLDDRALTALRRDRLGFVFQSFNLLPELTARHNILLPFTLAGRRPDLGHVQRLVATLGLADRMEHHPAQLSGGQQQRVAVARALAARPAVVFADEPTGALDLRTGRDLLAHLRRSCTEQGQTIVMVTHDAAAAAQADRVLVLTDGRISADVHDPHADQLVALLTLQEA